MKCMVPLAACLGGGGGGALLSVALGVRYRAAEMDWRDHDLAYRLLPVLGCVAVAAVVAFVVRSRFVFLVAAVFTLASLGIPEPWVRVRYVDVQSAAMGALRKSFWHSATSSTFLLVVGLVLAERVRRLAIFLKQADGRRWRSLRSPRTGHP